MKKFVLFTIVVFFSFSIFAQEWEVLSETPSARLDALDFLEDGLHGMAAGGQGEGLVLTTSDGGEIWEIVTAIPNCSPNALSLVSADSAWVVGSDGLIFATDDGGLTWNNQPSGTTRELRDVQFIDHLRGWAVGGWGDGDTEVVLRTTNGGQTWEDLTFGSDCFSVEAVSFIDAQTGWICGKAGGEPFVQKTEDGGDSWVDQVLPTFPQTGKSCGDIDFASAEIGWATTKKNNQEGSVIYTADGGTTWTIQTTTNRCSNFLAVKDPLHLAILGWKAWYTAPMIVKSSNDGGLTWVTNEVPTNAYSFSFSYVGSSIWLGSICSRILHSLDLGVNWEYQFRSPFLQSVDWIDNNSAWITSKNWQVYGFTLRTDDGGDNWTTDENSPAGNDIIVYDENTAWIMIEGNPSSGPATIFRTTDGGINWDSSTLPAGYTSGLTFVNADMGWAYGGDGNLSLTMDGGVSWSTQSMNTGHFISDIHFINPLEGWACGGYAGVNAFIRHTVDGGATWTTQNPASTDFLFDIYFFDSSNGLVVGFGGQVHSTSDGGDSWSILSTIPVPWLEQVLMLDSNTGWVIGCNNDTWDGYIYRTDNGGQSWTMEWSANLSGQHMCDIALNPSGTSILACGSNNTILRYQLSSISCDFLAEPLSGTAPLEVNFTDLSTGAITSWEWDFDNDGTIDSNEQNPTFTYTEGGIYTVVLTVGDGTNFVTETKVDYITVGDEIIADFSGDPLYGLAPLEVQFTDLSTGAITSWEWDFDNDGTIDSNEQDPSYTYTSAGLYTVVLTVGDGTSFDTETKVDYIEVTEVGTGGEILPVITSLSQNYPNPFNPSTTISFSVQEGKEAKLMIYNTKGQLLETHKFVSGNHNFEWNADGYPTGIYFYKLTSGDFEKTKKMILLR